MEKYLILIVFVLFMISVNANITNNCYVLNSTGIINEYPYTNNFIYAINFNKTLMQANYVYYITTSGGNGCYDYSDLCGNFRDDPYGINILTHDDYKYTGFDRGHIVPNADYGYDTYIISNVVPMLPYFNQQIWAKSEEELRQNYAGKLVYKGCDYSLDKFIISNLNNTLYVPIGCYYVIFNQTKLPDTVDIVRGQIIDYGYYLHSDEYFFEKTLPPWIYCE
ncbi:MAG: DNA/RNA endonuclease [Terrestrivirus sp.]|uniref:DNA/RNA endonuclease n=1 Tax=Terrestrivirus sp. TaxID=2487775 RepID=A0A3G4ZK07_9VIRU|nr:MAG: DNA/RNA endonuclease [Terrestrivirus sp.]